MPYLLYDLDINRVDLVDEGANSAAFIELYKRKETTIMNFDEILSKMKPEHASVIREKLNATETELAKAREDLTAATNERDAASEDLKKAKEDLANATSELDVLKSKSSDEPDETEVLKSMPKEFRDMYTVMKAQKEAAEEEVRKAKEAEATSQAIAKAKELKAIPIEQDKLVDIIKGASKEVLDVLSIAATAIEGTVLTEVGKSAPGSNSSESNNAWAKIEKKADEIVERDSVSKAKAISTVIKENPELYKEYLAGGAN